MMTYGNMPSTTIIAHCGCCGEYRRQEQLHEGKRGEQRCNTCEKQVAMKPRPSRQRLNTKRRQERKNIGNP